MAKKTSRLASGPVGRHLIDMTVPVLFGIATMMGQALIDAWFIGQVGVDSLAAYSFGFPILMIVSSIVTALADSPIQIAAGLFAVGVFAAIYHPVGLAMVVQGRKKTGIPLAINGVFGNLGVAAAALLTGWLIDTGSWRNGAGGNWQPG